MKKHYYQHPGRKQLRCSLFIQLPIVTGERHANAMIAGHHHSAYSSNYYL
ncbi:hypothetical protein [Chitinophaga sp.]